MQSVSNTTSNPSNTMIKYGNMNIPAKLIFYQKNYIYAMVPLAPKLSGRIKVLTYNDFILDIMLVPKRQVLNFKDLTPAEV